MIKYAKTSQAFMKAQQKTSGKAVAYRNVAALLKNKVNELKKKITKLEGRLRAKKEEQYAHVLQTIIKDQNKNSNAQQGAYGCTFDEPR